MLKTFHVPNDLYRRTAYALAHTHDLRRAVEMVEQGCARGLGETLDRDRADLVALQQAKPELVKQYVESADTLRRLESGERTVTSLPATDPAHTDPATAFITLTAQARTTRAEIDAVITAIRQVPGYATFLTLPTWADIVCGDDGHAAGLPCHGSLASIVPSGANEPEALLLDGFTQDNLIALLITREGDEVVGGYLPGQLGDHQMLTSALGTALPLLGEQLIGPLAVRLRELKAHGVTLVPTGLLSLLPLHAATYVVAGETRCLLDEFDVAYAPSARVLATAQREATIRQGALRLAGVGNPTRDLRYAGPELAAICELLPTGTAVAFYEEQARREALWQALPEATIAHLSCHGNFADDPLDSALHLAGGDRLTLRELVTGDTSALANLRLVVLSACQTAITDFQRVPDESIGLPGGFLQTGLPAVVGTLWSVNDLSTALLMHRFYSSPTQVVARPPGG